MPDKALLRKRLAELKIDGLLITDLTNVRYLSGFTGSSGFLVVTQRDLIFVTDFRYQVQSQLEVKGCSLRIERKERTKEIRDICDEYSIRKLGFEEHFISFGSYQKLLKRKIRLKPVSGVVEALRIIKSSDELSCIKKAVARAESAFRKLQPFIRTGSTELKIALKFQELLKAEGCKKLPFEVIVASGAMSALPHAKPTSRRLKKGDLVVFDWGGEYNGYLSDMSRTVLCKGKDVSKQKELYYNVLEAQKRAIDAVRAGRKTSAVDAAARNYISGKGYGEHFGHGTGHGVGLAVHEKPVVSWRNKEIIRNNMVFTVEPGIYLPDFGGVRIEDMVAVSRNRAVQLTTLPKRLKVIER
jgi:Xaa-Pro aminopeptidase